MASNGFDSDQFLRDTDAFARLVRAADFSARSRRGGNIPSSCVALLFSGAGQPRLARSGEAFDADGASEVLLVKTAPIALNYRISKLPSKDNFDIHAEVWISIQTMPERTELGLLRRELLGNRERADIRDLTRFCEEAVRDALAGFIRTRDAAALLSPEAWSEFDAVMAERFAPLGFSSGLALAGDVRLSLNSPDYDETRRATALQADRAKRAEAEAATRAAAMESHRKELEEMVSLIERAGVAKDSAAFLKTIQALDTTRRAEVYSGLMGLTARSGRTEAVLIVAGQELVWINPRDPQSPARRLSLPDSIGPLRSIRLSADRATALIGARSGVHVVDLSAGGTKSFVLKTSRELRGGVNAAVAVADRIYATHSEVGLTSWSIVDSVAPSACLLDHTRSAKSVRDVQLHKDRLWFTAGPGVLSWTMDASAPQILNAGAVIECLLAAGESVFAGLDNGAVLQWEIADPESPQEIRPPTGRPVHSLDWLAGGGAPRLLIADDQPHLTLQVLDDTCRAEYRWKRGLRWGFAAADFIIGVDESRDRLVLWRSEDPREPVVTVSIGQLTGHPIQDVGILACA